MQLTARRLITGDNATYEVTARPYDYLLVSFENDFQMEGTGFAKGEVYALPAIYVYALFHQSTMQKWKTSAEVGVMAGLSVLGAAEIAAAVESGSAAGFVTGAIDLGLGIGDVVLSSAFPNEVAAIYPRLAENWSRLALCWGIGRLAGTGLKSAFKQTFIESQLARFDFRLSTQAKETASKIKQELTRNVAQFAEFIDETDAFEEQVRLLKLYPFVEGRTLDADVLNYAYVERNGLAPYLKNSQVVDQEAKIGGKIYCVEYRSQAGPGNFFTDKIFSNEAEAREELALIWDFKKSHDLVIREYTIKSPFIFHKGIIGPQFDPTINKTYKGSGIQFEIPDEVKNNWPNYFVTQDLNPEKIRDFIIELK
ncbi:hypothetical protein [Larkinella soli]|uniref:hypothetical protein n=1 Tax=Larkinella soli TaxID=1770527 RepID=UPI000FFB9ADC|nr:hypothetical protein [Larkinella soli]